MRILIEICLTVCEWLQERGIQRSARKAARECEKKTILTFLSQGAVGGMVGYFVITTFFVIHQPTGYNFVYLVALPVILMFGSTIGAVAGVFVWLPGVVLKRRLGFVARAGMATAAVLAQGYAFSFVTGLEESDQWSLAWVIACLCAISLPVAIVTASGIKPCRLLALGSGQRKGRHNIGSWLAVPFGFLLRVASIFGLLEALMVLALWISARTVDWLDWPAREELPAIGLAILYFAVSAFLSLRSPRKFVLLPMAILLNLPLVGLMEHSRGIDMSFANEVQYTFMGFICLWVVYVLGRLIAPESARIFVNFPSQTAAADTATRIGPCQVQL